MHPFHLPDEPVFAVALSGGADSRLLLELTRRALLERHGEEGLSRLVALHLHHGIRGDEADRDLEFCRRICAESGVELISEQADVPALAAEWRESVETAARRARYAFFRRVMTRRGIPVLLTAHHADDNLETVLERILRGSGTRGMGGIPPSRLMDGWRETPAILLYRPLLEWTRREILLRCAEWGLDYVTDSTNLEDDCTRNRIRHTVIPALEAIAGPEVPQRAAARMSCTMREDEDFLWSMAVRRVEASRGAQGDRVELADAHNLHPAVFKRMLMYAFRCALSALTDDPDPEPFLSATHLIALTELAQKGIPASSLSLPGGLEARVRGEYLYLEPACDGTPALLPDPLTLPVGDIVFGDVTLRIEALPSPAAPLDGEDVWASAVFPPTLPLPLVARRREPGDTILSHGMTKRIKKILNEKDIPLHLRDRIPLICLADGEPLWFPRAAFRDGFPAPTHGACIRITVYLRG